MRLRLGAQMPSDISSSSSSASSDDEGESTSKKRARARDATTSLDGQPRKDPKKALQNQDVSSDGSDASDSASGESSKEDGASDVSAQGEDTSGDDSADDSEAETAASKRDEAANKRDEAARKQAAARVRQRLSVVPIVQASGQELAQMLTKLNSDGEDQLEALKLFEERARAAFGHRDTGGGDGADLIHAYFQGSPECSELFRVLAKGAAGGDKVRDSGKMNALMRLLQALLACHVVPLLLEHSRNLGTKIIRKANKAFIGAITSGKTRLFAETMRVLCRASELGVVQARDAWKKFSPYMKNMTRHLEVMKMEDKKNKEGPRVER